MKTFRVFVMFLICLLVCSGLAHARQIIWNVGAAGAPAYGDANTLTGAFDQLAFISQTSTIQFDTDGNGVLSVGDRILDAGDLRVRNLLASTIIDQEGLNEFGGYEVTSRWSNVEGYVTGVTLDPTTGVTQIDVRYTSGTLNLYLDTRLDSSFANPAGTFPPAGAGGTGFENGTLIATLVVKDGIGHTFINFSGGAVANQGSAELLLEFTYARNGFWLDGSGTPLDFTGSVVTAIIDMNLDTPTRASGPAGSLYTAYSNQDGSMLVESAQCLGKIGDYVWLDANRNGVQDAGEMGIDGVKVLLVDSQGNLKIATTFTGGPNNAPGFYQFENLCPGSYTVSIDRANSPVLAGLFESPVGQVGDPTKDSNNHFGTSVALSADNLTDMTIDFGYFSPCNGKIGDYVWFDKDRDGVQDADETGIDNATVTLDDGINPNKSATTFTGGPLNAPGYYVFEGLCAGSYTVKVKPDSAPLTGLTASPIGVGTPDKDSNNPAGTTVVLPTDNAEDLTIDFGYYSPCAGRIGDYVWFDKDRDGVQDTDETGIDNVTVTLDDGINPTKSATTFTGGPLNTPGYYIFEGLCAGNYIVKVKPDSAPLAGLTASPIGVGTPDKDSNNPAGTTVVLATDNTENVTIDFGYFSPCTGKIGDYVWFDKDADGVQDNDETGIDNVTVTLDDGINPTKTATTFTGGPQNVPGYYIFDGLCTGNYTVKVNPNSAPLAGLTASPIGVGTPDKDSNNPAGSTVLLTTDNSEDLTIDFGYYKKVCIGDYVWFDKDADGIQDADEMGVNGITVNLLDCNGNFIKSTTTVNGPDGKPGYYEFCDLLPYGSYMVQFVAPGYTFSPANQGADDTKDSDANASGMTGCITLTGTDDKTIDAGIYKPVCVPCKDGVTWMQLKLDFHQYPNYAPNDRIRVRADSLTGEILYDSKYDSVSTTGLPVGTIFSFNVPPSAKTVVVTVQGKYHTYETVKATFSAECDLLIGTISGNTYIKFKVMDAKFDGELSCTPKTPDIDVEKYVSNDGGKTWHDADDAPGLSVPLCTQTPPPATCGSCSGGITELTLFHKGSTAAKVVVKDSKGRQLYSNTVNPNTKFTFKGMDSYGTMTSYIKIYVGSSYYTIYTDCSKPIYPGMIVGSFTIDSGYSKNGGLLCAKLSSYSTKDDDHYASDHKCSSSCPSYSGSSSKSGSSYEFEYSKDNDYDDHSSYTDSEYTKAYTDSCGTIPTYASCKVQFKYVVTNTGTADLTTITLTDDVYTLTGKCTIPATLTPGQSFSCFIGPFDASAGQHTNTATVKAMYGSTQVMDTDKANYYGGKPTTGCVRSPGYWKNHPEAWPVQTIVIGGRSYSKSEAIMIMEKPVAGDKTYTMFPALVAAKLNVLSGADPTCISSVIAEAEQWMSDNPVGSGVIGSSSEWTSGNPLYLQLDKYNNGYLCASYCGDNNPPPTSYPKITIEKYTNGYDADMAPGPYIWVSDPVEWTYVVTNTGNTTLNNITVTDDKVSTISCPKSSLMSGETMTCTASGTATEGQYENKGCVVGYASGSVKVSDCDMSHYYGKKKDTQTSCGTGTPGYWQNHPDAWPTSSIKIGGITYTKAQAITIIAMSVAGDKTYTLFPALVSAKLNVMVGNNSSCIYSTIAAADAWMALYPPGSSVKGSSTEWKQGEPYYWALDNYNNGLLCAPHRDSSSGSCSSSVPSEYFN